MVNTVAELVARPLGAVDQKDFDRYLALAREALAPSAFGAAWSEGLEMTLDQAVHEATQAARS